MRPKGSAIESAGTLEESDCGEAYVDSAMHVSVDRLSNIRLRDWENMPDISRPFMHMKW